MCNIAQANSSLENKKIKRQTGFSNILKAGSHHANTVD